jgi:hypothetical protein
VTAGNVLSQDALDALFAEAADLASLDLRRGPLPAVLDTDMVRTGLHYQLKNGRPPRSVRTAWAGAVRLFMEYDTLAETAARLPRFAAQLGVAAADLRRVLNEDWLPYTAVVRLPQALRQADPRALEVRARDADDFPAAALAALLSPCLLLTGNYKHFGVLGVRTRHQGVDGVMAVAAITVGEMQIQAIITVPAIPARAAAAGVKWAADRAGPAAWVAVGALIGGGIWWYCKQPPERRDRIREAAVKAGTHLMETYATATEGVYRARLPLRTSLVPKPGHRTPVSAILRELALSPGSLSAAQLAELLDPAARPPVASLRAFLRAHDTTVFRQVRRGGFVLGSRYELSLRGSAAGILTALALSGGPAPSAYCRRPAGLPPPVPGPGRCRPDSPWHEP